MSLSPYKPLRTRSIRLLELLPALHLNTEPVRCTLRVVSLDNNVNAPCPNYKALSYAWLDDEEQTDKKVMAPIFCNGAIISIPTTLLYLLIRLRAQSQEPTMMLWADSICINQADLRERSEQVSLMKDIFRRSEEVVIWLGETGHVVEPPWVWTGDERDQPRIDKYQDSFDRLEPLRGEAQRGDGDDIGAFCLLSRLSQIDSASDIAFCEPRSSGSNGQFTWAQRVRRTVWRIANRAWWNRTWVVQECTLAKLATVMYGGMTAPWDMLASAAKVHMHNRAWIDTSQTVVDPLDSLSRLIYQVESPRAVLAAGKLLRPLQALQQFHVRRATDPRDKVFGILGLLDGNLIEPDYSMSKLDVFFHTAVEIISDTGRLDILNGVHSSDTPGMPTWCTDWGAHQDQDEWQRIKCLGLYDASAGIRCPISLHGAQDCRILEVRGIVVDTVQTVNPVRAPEDGMARWRATIHRWAGELGSLALSDNFWMSLCGGLLYVDGGQEAGEGGFRRASPADRRKYLPWTADDTAKKNRKSKIIQGSLTAYGEFTRSRNEFYYAMQTMTARRRLFITTSGRIGVGPSWVGRNDTVVVLAGSSVPFLLRRSKILSCKGTPVQPLAHFGSEGTAERVSLCTEEHTCYEVVGDAYISGLMDSEATSGRGSEMIRIHLI